MNRSDDNATDSVAPKGALDRGMSSCSGAIEIESVVLEPPTLGFVLLVVVFSLSIKKKLAYPFLF